MPTHGAYSSLSFVQVAVGSVQEPDTEVNVAPVAAYPAQLPPLVCGVPRKSCVAKPEAGTAARAGVAPMSVAASRAPIAGSRREEDSFITDCSCSVAGGRQPWAGPARQVGLCTTMTGLGLVGNSEPGITSRYGRPRAASPAGGPRHRRDRQPDQGSGR